MNSRRRIGSPVYIGALLGLAAGLILARDVSGPRSKWLIPLPMEVALLLPLLGAIIGLMVDRYRGE